MNNSIVSASDEVTSLSAFVVKRAKILSMTTACFFEVCILQECVVFKSTSMIKIWYKFNNLK